MTTRWRRRGFVLVLLAAIGAGGWTLAARGQRPHAAVAADPGHPEHSESRQAVTMPRAVADALLPAGGPPWDHPGITGEVGLDRIEWTPSPGVLEVTATAVIWEREPDPDPFVWRVEIRERDADGQVVVERTYAEQAFRVPAGEVARPTLADRWALPPGDYWATLELRRGVDVMGGPTDVRVP